MTNRNSRQECNLNERIAVIRENNARLENRHREIELDKKRAVETGSSIHPSQIKITICRNDTKPTRNGAYEISNHRNKGRQGYRSRGGGVQLEYKLSKSLSRLSHDSSHADSQSHQQQQLQPNRQQGGRGGCGGGRGASYSRGGGGGNPNYNYPPADSFRHVEIDRYSNRGSGNPQRYSQHHNVRSFHGSRNGQYQSITTAKSMPSLDPALFNQNPRPFNSGNQGRGGGSSARGNLRPQNLPPRFRHNSYKGGPPGGLNGGSSKMCPPPPPPFPPPSPSQPTPFSSQKWPSNRDRSAPWVRGNVISSRGPGATVSAKGEEVPKSIPDADCPFINADEDDDDGYIDDNPLDDLDQFTLKIDMDGGFIVHDATICDPILSKPISSWIDEVANELSDGDGETKGPASKLNASRNPEENFKSPGKDGFDLDGYIFSNSSLTTSGVSTLSSLDCRSVNNDTYIRPIPRSYSADQLEKTSKPH